MKIVQMSVEEHLRKIILVGHRKFRNLSAFLDSILWIKLGVWGTDFLMKTA